MPPPAFPVPEVLGPSEGALNLVVWQGYAEDGSEKSGADWVHGFEDTSGCQVNAKVDGTSDETVAMMVSGQYDAVSASGDATVRLIAAGDIAPINTALINTALLPSFADICPTLKNQPWNSVGGVAHGVPHGRGANVLMYDTAKVATPPTGNDVFDPASRPDDHPGQRRHRLVRHLDDLLQRRSPQLRPQVAEPHHLPRINAQVAEYHGVAPANSKACAHTVDPDSRTRRHADDESYWKDIYYWSTPIVDCHDSRGSVRSDFATWVKAWAGITG